MVEMAVVLPVLVLIIHGIFFFGLGYVHKEKVEMAARFAAWQKIVRPGDGMMTSTENAGYPDYYDVSLIRDLVKERYFNNEEFHLAFGGTVCDQARVQANAEFEQRQQEAGASFEGISGWIGDLVVDKLGGILGETGGEICAEVKYTYNPSFLPLKFIFGRDVAGAEVSATHVVVGNYFTHHEIGGVLDIIDDATGGVIGALGEVVGTVRSLLEPLEWLADAIGEFL
jgi:hypothetical protein